MATVHITQDFRASRTQLYEAWVNPVLLQHWMFKREDNEIVRVTTDVEVGGRFSVIERVGGDEIDHCGEYLEVERPRRLAFTLETPRHSVPGAQSRTAAEPAQIALDITDLESGSRLAFTQSGADAQRDEASWRAMFVRLARVVESPEQALKE